MLLVSQIHVGANLIADGTLLLTDAADQGGFVTQDAYSNTELTAAIAKLRKLASDLEHAQAALRANDEPVRHLEAAE